MKKIFISSDHAGFKLKEDIKKHLKSLKLNFNDLGPVNDNSVDYPDFVHPVVKDVINKTSMYGILICGTANGVAITANKYREIRAGLSWNIEVVKLIRQHNNANILCIPARYTSTPQVLKMVETFLNIKFEGGRHKKRIDKMMPL